MQPIFYNVGRSSFRPAIDAALRGWSDRSRPLAIPLKPLGYKRDVRIVIERGNDDAFQSTWRGEEGRFSARLRAAATALRDLGRYGEYRAVHRDGTVTLTLLREGG
ncbi:hypothetical protein [Longimicrobium sp.]|uniref:hypothetical protein n=1 Tax=Longimicrobium sp. TaxID=2029185 RepID=UPI002E328E7A|nr:hypothetical protein [Longimicrobium sp.]HEX6039080.1 hypothetical protein [Longimicrobium sp.]